MKERVSFGFNKKSTQKVIFIYDIKHHDPFSYFGVFSQMSKVLHLLRNYKITYDKRYSKVLHDFGSLYEAVDGRDEDVATRTEATIKGLETVAVADTDWWDQTTIRS